MKKKLDKPKEDSYYGWYGWYVAAVDSFGNYLHKDGTIGDKAHYWDTEEEALEARNNYLKGKEMNVLKELYNGKKLTHSDWYDKKAYIMLKKGMLKYYDTETFINGIPVQAEISREKGQWLIYEPNPTEELTIEQICKELGRDVKIVKG